MRKYAFLKWVIPGFLAVWGAILLGFDPVSFLGILCLCAAAVLSGFFLLYTGEGKIAKLLRRALWVLVALVLICGFVTGIFVANGDTSIYLEPCDYILVLGCTVEGDKPGPILQNRIDEAYRYLTKHPDTVAILTGGKGSEDQLSEAQCMFNELTSMGIAPERLWLEESATSTKENFLFSVERIREETGEYPQRLGVLSSETHLFRASLYAQSVDVECSTIAAKTTNPIYYANYFLRELPCVWNLIIFGG